MTEAFDLFSDTGSSSGEDRGRKSQQQQQQQQHWKRYLRKYHSSAAVTSTASEPTAAAAAAGTASAAEAAAPAASADGKGRMHLGSSLRRVCSELLLQSRGQLGSSEASRYAGGAAGDTLPFAAAKADPQHRKPLLKKV